MLREKILRSLPWPSRNRGVAVGELRNAALGWVRQPSLVNPGPAPSAPRLDVGKPRRYCVTAQLTLRSSGVVTRLRAASPGPLQVKNAMLRCRSCFPDASQPFLSSLNQHDLLEVNSFTFTVSLPSTNTIAGLLRCQQFYLNITILCRGLWPPLYRSRHEIRRRCASCGCAHSVS